MPRMIFVNLPVADLSKATAFYEAIGATKHPQFSNDKASCMVLSETIHVMLLVHDFFRTFTPRPISDATKASEVLNCLSAESRAEVDSMLEMAAGAGGTADIGPKQEHGGFMYGRSFTDPDGHIWEVMHMDIEAAQKAMASEAQPA